jgi:SAM-dependent methyltransferase
MPERPIDVATRETVEFILTHVAQGASLLEIGCGRGEVAHALGLAGYRVTAIDADTDAVASARALGVDAKLATWPDFEGPRVEAIAFTRSLHHIGPLDPALQRVRAQLVPGGLLLVDDFAFGTADAATIDWFLGVLRSDEAARLLQPVPHEFVTHLLGAEDPHEAWRHDHGHEIHEIGTMVAAVSGHFDVERLAGAPYLYRYLVPVVPDTRVAADFVESTLRAEADAIARGRITAIGRRIVAREPRD